MGSQTGITHLDKLGRKRKKGKKRKKKKVEIRLRLAPTARTGVLCCIDGMEYLAEQMYRPAVSPAGRCRQRDPRVVKARRSMAWCVVFSCSLHTRESKVLRFAIITSWSGQAQTRQHTALPEMEEQTRQTLQTAGAVALIIGFVILCAVAGRICVKRNRTDAPLL
jgi:hypothetical protein